MAASRKLSLLGVEGALFLATLLLSACGGGLPSRSALRAPRSAGSTAGASTCGAVHNPLEPNLVAWDADDRAQINLLRSRGAVAVRYSVKGCHAELEILPSCTAEARYDFTPMPSTEHEYIENQRDLFAELPLGAASLSAQVSGRRVLRTDYSLVGVASLAAAGNFSPDKLHGPGCAKATHVIGRIYVGGFAMAAGDKKALEAQASLLDAPAGAALGPGIQRMSSGGDAEACGKAEQTGKESPLCDVPLRIGLIPLSQEAQQECPSGTQWDGQHCVPGRAPASAQCPPGTQWNGKECTKGAQASSSRTGTAAPSAGSLSGQQAQAVVARNVDGIRSTCWPNALRSRDANAPTTARVVATVRVAASGRVAGVSTSGDPPGYHGLASCVGQQIRSWTFPKSASTSVVNVPFVFQLN